MRSPRLLTLDEAKAYLSGKHPAILGVQPIGRGRGAVWDIRAIDAALDAQSGLAQKTAGPANDISQSEVDALAQRINNASRRASARHP
jgi:hypothetical protein